jgi:hypothetical protein
MTGASIAGLGTLFLLSSLALPAQPKPDLSGDYVLNKERSRLQVRQFAQLEKATLKIVHKGGSFEFQRVFTAQGKELPHSYRLTIGDQEVAGEEDGLKQFSRLYWDSGTLVFQTRTLAPRGEATNTVRYTLEENGRVLRALELFRGPRLSYDNLWLFERQP